MSRKLSPRSIPYRAMRRSGSVVLVAVFASGPVGSRLPGGRLSVIALAAVAIAVTVLYEVAYYRRFDYELTGETFDVHSGVVSRREREIPYRRIQNVDISRSAVQRLLGIAEVALETAGGSETEGVIRYVSIAEAERLQHEVQRRKEDATDERAVRSHREGAIVDADSAVNADADGRTAEALFALAPAELGLVGALSFDARVVGLITILVPGSVPFVSDRLPDPGGFFLSMGGLLAAAGLLLAAWGAGIAVAVVNYYGFRLTRVGDEIRYERGLGRRYSGSIPLSKVQALVIGDNPLMREFDYARLSVETAGYAPGAGGARGSQAAVPIARRDRVFALADELESFGDPSFVRPPKRIRRRYAVRYLLAIGVLAAAAYAADWYLAASLPWYAVAGFLVVVPPAAHLKWRHRGYWLGDDHIVTRNGVWNRSITVVPYYRIQTVIDSRTMFQRRWDVASVVVDTAGASSLVGYGAAAVDIEVDEARELREALADRLGAALSERRRGRRSSGRPAE